MKWNPSLSTLAPHLVTLPFIPLLTNAGGSVPTPPRVSFFTTGWVARNRFGATVFTSRAGALRLSLGLKRSSSLTVVIRDTVVDDARHTMTVAHRGALRRGCPPLHPGSGLLKQRVTG